MSDTLMNVGKISIITGVIVVSVAFLMKATES